MMITQFGHCSSFNAALSAWRREEGTCSASARGLHLPYTISPCDFNNIRRWLGYHSLFCHSMNVFWFCSFCIVFLLSLSYHVLTVYVNNLEK